MSNVLSLLSNISWLITYNFLLGKKCENRHKETLVNSTKDFICSLNFFWVYLCALRLAREPVSLGKAIINLCLHSWRAVITAASLPCSSITDDYPLCHNEMEMVSKVTTSTVTLWKFKLVIIPELKKKITSNSGILIFIITNMYL